MNNLLNLTVSRGETSDMNQPPTDFSEFGFTFAVAHHLVNFRLGPPVPMSRRLVFTRKPNGASTISPAERKKRLEDWLTEMEKRTTSIKHVLKSESLLEDDDKLMAATGLFAAGYFPTTVFEKGFPVDLAMNVRGVCCFLQFKRSKAVRGVARTIKESEQINNPAEQFDLPLYRVQIGGKESGSREQWDKLNDLENHLNSERAALVRYVAPAFHTLPELSSFHNYGFGSRIKGRHPVMCFKASAFLPLDDESHWISFDGTSETGWRYSLKPKKVEVLPLIKEIEQLAQEAPVLGVSIGSLSESLNGFAKLRKEKEDKLRKEKEDKLRKEREGKLRKDREYIQKEVEEDKQKEFKPKKGEEDNYLKQLSDRAVLNVFGISIIDEDTPAPSGEQAHRTSPGIGDGRESDLTNDLESELADTVQEIIESGKFQRNKSRMSFAKDHCLADYWCRQIMEHPLMVRACIHPSDLPLKKFFHKNS